MKRAIQPSSSKTIASSGREKKRKIPPIRRSQRSTRYQFHTKNEEGEATIYISDGDNSDEIESVARVHFVDKRVKESQSKKYKRTKSVKLEMEKKKSYSKKKNVQKEVVFNSILGRSSPRWLKSIIQAAIAKQKNLIHSLGLGFLVDWYFDFDAVPLKLGLFVVQIFDPQTCRLNFPDGRAIRVTKELIHDVLGFSITESPINIDQMKNVSSVIYEEFRNY